ncbi:MAG: phosphotransferase enzyme family protein, partial [Flavitalea sp.]
LSKIVDVVLSSYGLDINSLEYIPYGSGLINHTWKVTATGKEYILQKVNDSVFSDPAAIAANTRLIADHLENNHPEYLFISPLLSVDGKDLIYQKGDGYYRLFPFLKNSHSKDTVDHPVEAYEAALQFGRFSRLLSDVDTDKLKITLPDFHNLSLRFQQFTTALNEGDLKRISESKSLIDRVKSYSGILDDYRKIRTMADFRLRVTHHDTKISNVLFDAGNLGLCVIDLDTVMPGYFISDVGDMMRTYLCPVSEEEKDFQKIHIRDEIYQAILHGYMEEMNDILSKPEKDHFFYSGKFMIYMQALRFLTDHLLNDQYYGAKYEGHNYSRAKNQLVLLDEFCAKEQPLRNISSALFSV